MKTKMQTDTATSTLFKSKMSSLVEGINEMPFDLITINTYDEIKRKLIELTEEIESVGKICDSRMQASYEEFKSVLDKEDDILNNQIQSSINDLRKEIIRKKNETIPKYKGEYIDLRNKLFKIVKEVNESQKVQMRLDNKHNLLQESDSFYSSQMDNARELNVYLNYKLKLLTENKYASLTKRTEENVTIKHTTMDDTPIQLDELEKKKELLTSIDSAKHLAEWFDLNEKAISKKLIEYNKQLLKNMTKYKNITSDNEKTYMGLFKSMINQHLLKKNEQKNKISLPSVNSRSRNNRYIYSQTDANVRINISLLLFLIIGQY